MRLRHPLTAAMISILAAAPATASVLSASSQAVGTKSSKADYLQVTTVQDELNLTVKELNAEAAGNTGDLAAPAPNVAEGGYILQKEGDGSGDPRDWSPSTQSGSDGREGGRLTLPTIGGKGSTPGDSDVQGGANIRRPGDGRRRGGGGSHATPEPSTWMLLGAGLALFGGYAVMRRREQLEH